MSEARAVVLGIDPSTRHVGYALLECARPGQPKYLESGVLEGRGGTLDGRLASIYWLLRRMIELRTPTVLAVETGVIYQPPKDPTKRNKSNPMTALHQAEARGVILGAAHHCRLDVARYSPSEVKQAATGKGNAKKEIVQRYVAAIFRLGCLQPDEADALAVALAHANRLHLNEIKELGTA